jgi:hypothetical protein
VKRKGKVDWGKLVPSALYVYSEKGVESSTLCKLWQVVPGVPVGHCIALLHWQDRITVIHLGIDSVPRSISVS